MKFTVLSSRFVPILLPVSSERVIKHAAPPRVLSLRGQLFLLRPDLSFSFPEHDFSFPEEVLTPLFAPEARTYTKCS